MMNLTLYELAAEDFSVQIRKGKEFGLDIGVECDEDGKKHFESGVHPYAAESLAVFCRSYLRAYDRAIVEAEL